LLCLTLVGTSVDAWAQPDEDQQDPAQDQDEDQDADAQDQDEQGQDYEPAEQPTTQEPHTVCHGRRIRRIRVRGNRRVAAEDIQATIQLRRGLPCTDQEVARDARALWDLGFFDDVVVDATLAGQEVDLLFAVRERPAVGRIVFEGNDEVEDSDLEEKVTLSEGAILSIPTIREQVTRIRDLYAEKGYFLARVSYRLRRMDENEVEVRFVIAEGSEVTVRRIRFIGNDHIPADELTSFMRTSETGFWSFLSSNDTFQREYFDEDVNRLQALYYDRGYLAVQVGTPRIELTPDRRFIDLTIPIDEGPRFKIGRLRISEVDADDQEVEPLGGRRHLREQIQANPGDWFSRSTIAQNLLEVTRYYRDRGYARVEMVPETELDMQRRVVHVVISIRRGPIVRIERINIRGNDKTRDLVIRREIQIVEGERYHQTRIEESKNRIQALGYFERVDMSEEEGSAPDRIIVNFEVQERATGTFQVGAGFSSIESFIFTAQIQQQNLFGRGQSLTLQLQLSGIRQLAQVRFVEPYFLNTDWTMALEAFKTIRQYQEFNRDSTGGSITLGHPLFTDDLRLFLQYKAEYVDISARSGGLFGSGGAGLNIFRRSPLFNLFRDGLTSSVRLSLSYDRRDNRLFPTRGIYASYSTEVADEYTGSENIFIRHTAFARFYYPILGGLVLKLNTEWGLVTSRDPTGVPVFERFFLGGIFNVRGFGLNSVGPRLGLTRSIDPLADVAPQGTPLGGNMQLFYNLELEFPILEAVGIRGVIFTDGGNAWNLERTFCEGGPDPSETDPATDPCSTDISRLRTSWGFGFRWISPLGPLRFEWGLPFNPRSYEQDILFEFTIGNFF
jgi:outer membrane protein insertion porin family